MATSLQWGPEQIIELENSTKQTIRYRLKRFLGGGATSVVWLADELDSPIPRSVAIKTLRPETESQWRNAFEDEIEVLRTLTRAELNRNDGIRAVPELYAVSAKEKSPAFLVMEYVPYPSVVELALPPHNLPRRLADVDQTWKNLNNYMRGILTDLMGVVGGDQGLTQEMSAIAGQMRESRTKFEALVRDIDRWFAEHKGLDEADVAFVGAQVCRVLQLLHRSGRGYKDFQLQNVRCIRSDSDGRLEGIKIIDWNVVTAAGQIDLDKGIGMELVLRDLTRLASYLFWLCTFVRGPEEGASPRRLARLGGAAWTERTSLALRMILERALASNPDDRYPLAYDFNESEGEELLSPRQMRSLGAALATVERWHRAQVGELVALAGKYKDQGMLLESLALVELARQRLDQEPEDFRAVFAHTLDRLDEEIGDQRARPAFEQGQRLLGACNAASAAQAFAEAIREAPDDLEAHRWLTVARSLQALPFAELRTLWESQQLQVALDNLRDGRWDEARTALRSVVEKYPQLELSALSWDVDFGQALTEIEQQWEALQAYRHGQSRPGEISQAEARKLVDAFARADQLWADRGKNPYSGLFEQRWREMDFWRKQAEAQLQQLSEQDTLIGIQQAFEQGVEAGIDAVSVALARTPGAPEILQLGLGQAERLLKEGQLEPVMKLCRIMYDYVGTGPYREQIMNLWRVAQAWLNLRQGLTALDALGEPSHDVTREQNMSCVTIIDGIAGTSIDVLMKTTEPIKQAAAQEVAQRFVAAHKLKRLETCRRLAALEGRLLRGTEIHSEEIRQLEAELADEKRRLQDRLREQIAGLIAQNTSESLARAQLLLSELLSMMSPAEAGYSEVVALQAAFDKLMGLRKEIPTLRKQKEELMRQRDGKQRERDRCLQFAKDACHTYDSPASDQKVKKGLDKAEKQWKRSLELQKEIEELEIQLAELDRRIRDIEAKGAR